MSPIQLVVARPALVLLAAALGGTLLSPPGAAQIAGADALVLKSTTSCQPSWIPTFGGMPGTDGTIRALTVFDDGSGPALCAGGSFAVSPAGGSYLAKWGCPAIASLPGCAGNPATFAALAPSAPLGKPLPLRISGSLAQTGLGAVYFGDPGFDGSGCGLVLPGLGELLIALSPTPLLVTSGPLAGGTCDLAPLVPSIPALVGKTKHLQGLAFDPGLPSPIELTNALAVTFGP